MDPVNQNHPPVSKTPRMFYLILHGVWVAYLGWYASNRLFLGWQNSVPEINDPFVGRETLVEIIPGIQREFFIYTFILVGAVTSYILIFRKRKKGWWFGVVSLMGAVLAFFLSQNVWEVMEHYLNFAFFNFRTNSWVLGLSLFLSLVQYLAPSVILPGLMLWLNWIFWKRGAFHRDGVV